MIHLFGRLAVQALLAIAPLVTLPWSLVDLIGYERLADDRISTRIVGIAVIGPKTQVELKLRLSLVFMALVVSSSIDVISQIAEVYLPRQRLQDFRGDFLEQRKREWTELLSQEAEHVRVNVMFARRPWHFPFARRLYWTWSTGYNPPDHHRDANLAFWEWQGVCGAALRQERPLLADFRKAPARSQSQFWKNDFRLGPKQFRRTRDVQAVLSIPLYAKVGREAPAWKAVGVINLDSSSAIGAELLIRNQQKLTKYFVPIGMSIAQLWV